MTRIIGGTAGGRRLRTPAGESTRPTSDRVREALFSSLESLYGGLDDLGVLDLYAGSGALGLEALSRGATRLTAVESDRAAARLVADNARSLGFGGVEVVGRPVATALATEPRAAFDLVLADPPYPLGEDDLARTLAQLVEGGWLADAAVVVVERSARSPEPGWPAGLVPLRHKTYGETALWYVRAQPEQPEPPDQEGPHPCAEPSAPGPSTP